MIRIIFVAFLLTISTGRIRADEIDFLSCDEEDVGHQVGEFTSVAITGCDEEECVIKSGENNTAEADFTPDADYAEVTVTITTSNWLKAPLVHEKPICGEYIECPLKANQSAHFEYKNMVVDIPWYIPTELLENVPLNASIIDKETGKVIGCFTFEVSVK